MFLFCKAKAKTASRGREKFPSGNLLVAKSFRRHPGCDAVEFENYVLVRDKKERAR